MKKALLSLGFVFVGLVAIGELRALGQVAPFPFTSSSYLVSSDAGVFGALTTLSGITNSGGTVKSTGNFVVNQSTNSGVALCLDSSCAMDLFESSGSIRTTGSFQIGNNGTAYSNVIDNTCVLSGGTCNLAMTGVQGSSICYCDIQGGNWAIDAGAFTCHARADAGSATIWVQAGATPIPGGPTGAVHCVN